MKKLCIVLSILLMFAAYSAIAETITIEDPSDLMAALENPDYDSVIITGDGVITEQFPTLTKNVTIRGNVVFWPESDPESFYVKSIIIPDGTTLTIEGVLETRSTFDEIGLTIAQIYVLGGTLDVSVGQVNDNCNICCNAGTVIPPKGGFGPDVEVHRVLYDDVTEESLTEAVNLSFLRTVELQTECTLTQDLTVPEGMTLEIWDGGVLIIPQGVTVKGRVIADQGCIILYTGATLNDITTPRYASRTELVGDETSGPEAFRSELFGLDGKPLTVDRFEIPGFGEMVNVVDENNMTIYREGGYDAEGVPTFWAYYIQYHFDSTDYWSVDYEALSDGEHRFGTDYMVNTGSGPDDFRQVASDYRLDDGTTVHEDYSLDGSCTSQRRDPNGTLTLVRRISPSFEILYTWDMTDGRTLVLPRDTAVIGAGAFADIDADKIVPSSALTTIEEGTVSRDMLFLLEKNSSLCATLEEGGWSYIFID